jgi:LysR family transcriptional regulator, transcriptional activator for bauABCD operon
MIRSEVSAIPSFTEGDLRLLGIFRAVAEAGGLTAAETKLRMERSTISRHIQSLEARLGARLCHRGPSGFELTEFGRVALRASIAACDTLEAVRNELNFARNVIVGEVRVGIADNCITNPQTRLVPAIRQFRSLAPDVTLDVRVRPPRELLDDLLSRHIHIGITGAPVGDSHFDYEELFIEEFRLYAGPVEDEEELDLKDIAAGKASLIVREQDRHSLALAKRLGVEHSAVASGLEAVATLLASGGYAAFLPTHYVAGLPRLSAFREVKGAADLIYRAPFSVVIERSRSPSPAVALFRKQLLDCHQEACMTLACSA